MKYFKNNINENNKNRIWKKMPLFIRPFLFFYGLIYKLGFLMVHKGYNLHRNYTLFIELILIILFSKYICRV